MGKLPEKGLQGTWKMLTEQGDDATYTLKLYTQQDTKGYNGDLTIAGTEDGHEIVEFHRLTVFVTQVQGVGIVNIGLNTGEPEGEYLFARYTWEQDKLKVFYVNENAFINANEQITRFADMNSFRARFEELLAAGDLFEETPVTFTKID